MLKTIENLLRALRASKRGATAIEYALIASMVVGAAMGGMIALGGSLDLLFTSSSGHVAAHTPPPSAPPPPRCVVVGSACPK